MHNFKGLNDAFEKYKKEIAKYVQPMEIQAAKMKEVHESWRYVVERYPTSKKPPRTAYTLPSSNSGCQGDRACQPVGPGGSK